MSERGGLPPAGRQRKDWLQGEVKAFETHLSRLPRTQNRHVDVAYKAIMELVDDDRVTRSETWDGLSSIDNLISEDPGEWRALVDKLRATPWTDKRGNVQGTMLDKFVKKGLNRRPAQALRFVSTAVYGLELGWPTMAERKEAYVKQGLSESDADQRAFSDFKLDTMPLRKALGIGCIRRGPDLPFPLPVGPGGG